MFVSLRNPTEIQKISQSKIITIVDMTRKSRYPAHFSGNIAIYLYIIWINRCVYDLLFSFFIFYLYLIMCFMDYAFVILILHVYIKSICYNVILLLLVDF